MIYKINVKDNNAALIKGATVVLQSDDGYGKIVLPANGTGIFTIDTNAASLDIPDLSGVTIIVSAPGYQSLAVSGSNLQPDNDFILLPAAAVQSLLPALGLGALIVIGYNQFAGKKKKGKRVKGFDVKRDVLPYVVPAAVVIGGVIIYNKIFGSTPEDKARQQALDADIAAAGPGTLSDSEISTIANSIKEDLGYSGISNNTLDAARQLTKPSNTADMLRLVKAYGTHVITFFGVPTGTYTLEETVTRQMADYEISEINKYYDAQGINFKF